MPPPSTPEYRIAEAMWFRWQAHGGPVRRDHYMPLRSRVAALLEGYDEDCVYVTCLARVDELKADFDPTVHLSTMAFAWAVDRLDVPPGAWRYQRWLDQEPRQFVKDSIGYWLDLWEDGLAAANRPWVDKARWNLANLERIHYPFPANVLRVAVDELEVVDLA